MPRWGKASGQSWQSGIDSVPTAVGASAPATVESSTLTPAIVEACAAGNVLDLTSSGSDRVGEVVPGLACWLQELQLEAHIARAVSWVDEQGACSLEEVLENLEDFTDSLRLSPPERERLRHRGKTTAQNQPVATATSGESASSATQEPVPAQRPRSWRYRGDRTGGTTHTSFEEEEETFPWPERGSSHEIGGSDNCLDWPEARASATSAELALRAENEDDPEEDEPEDEDEITRDETEVLLHRQASGGAAAPPKHCRVHRGLSGTVRRTQSGHS
mmetsp:Transcript_25852/g.74092  ORF Transcript_25852/g.74092 Transcript_25852/m.74092 type:complete len:275 (-) Transcript_25852:90-914(-)